MLYSQRVFHFEICKRGQYYYIDYGPYLESLEHVVDHYMSHPDGLPAELQRPIRPPHPVNDDQVILRVVYNNLNNSKKILKEKENINFYLFQDSQSKVGSPTVTYSKYASFSFAK